jgi:hypothetical protein
MVPVLVRVIIIVIIIDADILIYATLKFNEKEIQYNDLLFGLQLISTLVYAYHLFNVLWSIAMIRRVRTLSSTSQS